MRVSVEIHTFEPGAGAGGRRVTRAQTVDLDIPDAGYLEHLNIRTEAGIVASVPFRVDGGRWVWEPDELWVPDDVEDDADLD